MCVCIFLSHSSVIHFFGTWLTRFLLNFRNCHYYKPGVAVLLHAARDTPDAAGVAEGRPTKPNTRIRSPS